MDIRYHRRRHWESSGVVWSPAFNLQGFRIHSAWCDWLRFNTWCLFIRCPPVIGSLTPETRWMRIISFRCARKETYFSNNVIIVSTHPGRQPSLIGIASSECEIRDFAIGLTLARLCAPGIAYRLQRDVLHIKLYENVCFSAFRKLRASATINPSRM